MPSGRRRPCRASAASSSDSTVSSVVWKRGGPARPVAIRFWEKVDRSGGAAACWIWMAADIGNGYGTFAETPYKRTLAHRMAWRLSGRAEIPAGMDLCHSCDIRNCVNPAHLFVGTRADNLRDCHDKMRHSYGERHYAAKLTSDAVMQIRKLRALGHPGAEIASAFGISASHVSDLCAGRRWKHIPL